MATRSKKPRADPQSPNKELASMLLELGEYEKNVNRQPFKYNAYRKAAQSIMDYPQRIEDIKEAIQLKSVGKRIGERIKEYLTKGKISQLDTVRKSHIAKYIKELTRVTGIGPSHAHKFLKEGIKSLDDLRANQDILTHHQKIGLKYVDDFEMRIPRNEMLAIQEFVKSEIEKIDKNYVATFCGSFRRGSETSADVDILLTHHTYISSSHVRENKELKNKKHLIVTNEKSAQHLLEKVVNKLINLNFITDTLALGETKFMGVCSLNHKHPFRRIDIRLIPYDQYWCGIFYYTGSDMFNRNIRKIAHEKGFLLNEYSLRKLSPSGIPGKALHVKSEEEIFKHLGLDYKPPEDRKD